jgi:cytidylate kinase
VSRLLARRLGWRYLDTGAMYRAMTWAALARGIAVTDAAALTELARDLPLELGTDPDDPFVRVAGADVGTAIRGRDVERAVSAVSAISGVRAQMAARQRAIAAAGDIVVEGRDIGSTVLPHAAPKIFLTAHESVRAHRRSGDGTALAAAAGSAPDPRRTREELGRRDRLDAGRVTSPLRAADDAVELDSSTLTVDEVVDRISALPRPEPR